MLSRKIKTQDVQSIYILTLLAQHINNTYYTGLIMNLSSLSCYGGTSKLEMLNNILSTTKSLLTHLIFHSLCSILLQRKIKTQEVQQNYVHGLFTGCGHQRRAQDMTDNLLDSGRLPASSLCRYI